MKFIFYELLRFSFICNMAIFLSFKYLAVLLYVIQMDKPRGIQENKMRKIF